MRKGFKKTIKCSNIASYYKVILREFFNISIDDIFKI